LLNKLKFFIVSGYNKLPKEVKVALYIAVSYGLSELVIELGKLEVSSYPLTFGINVLLVFLKELKPRVERYRSK
jgi:hypothetical protein